MKRLLRRARRLDPLSRTALVLLVAILSYIAFICIAFPLLRGERTLLSDSLLDLGNPEHVHLNLIAAVLGLGMGVAAALLTNPRENECPEKGQILSNVLSKNEQEVVDIVRETGEITQDSLTFRLGWSRPKVSTIVTNLERMNLVQRTRVGKTYAIIPAKAAKRR